MGDLLSEAAGIDVTVYTAIAASDTPRVDRAMRRLSSAADHSKLWAAAAAALALTGGPTGRDAARRGLLSIGAASAFTNLVAKPLTARRRPHRETRPNAAARYVPMPRSSSFPSGHTASAFAFATGAGLAAPIASAPLRALAGLVGYSRVHTGVHFPGDVLVGGFIGVSAGELVGWLERRRRGGPA